MIEVPAQDLEVDVSNDRMFDQYIGIDYAGGDTPVEPNGDLGVCLIDTRGKHTFPTTPYPRSKNVVNWSRRDIANWLVAMLKDKNTRTLVGIDHAFSFPTHYFKHYRELLRGGWDGFLKDFQNCWCTDEENATVRARYYDQIERMMGPDQTIAGSV